MQVTRLSFGRIFVIAAFALSCFGLLVFLWLSFGGSVPLQPQGYRVNVRFAEAVQLAEQADVRIAGVPVGKVVALRPVAGRTEAEIELQRRFAPLRSDARATLRQKTLLGETFVELTFGTRNAHPLPEGALLDPSRVQQTTELDEVLRALDAPTRRDLRTWLSELEVAVRGRGPDVSAAVANAAPFAEETTGLLARVDAQSAVTGRLIRDGGVVLRTVGRRETAVRRLIRNGNRVLARTAARDAELRRTVRELPPFLRALRPALAELAATSRAGRPVVRALLPVAPLVRPTLEDLSVAVPDLGATLRRVDPIIDASATALPAADRLLRAARPLVGQLHPLGRELVPVTEYLARHRQEIIASWANTASFFQASEPRPGRPPLHYARGLLPVNKENFLIYRKREPTNRSNAYPAPRWLDRLPGTLESFSCEHTGNAESFPATGPSPPCLTQRPQVFRDKRGAYVPLLRDPP
jgi:phospholipid/cholesterol/gamma-HCH transport system substrate-binding protein